MPKDDLTQRQRRYRSALRNNLEKNTGRSLAAWLTIARQCPHRAPRARLRWFKETHGLGQNYALCVLSMLESPAQRAAKSPQGLRAHVWSEPGTAQILAAIEAAVGELPDLISAQRKAYTAWSRSFAFAAARPARARVRLGLALDPGSDARLTAAQRERWSQRLKSTLLLSAPAEVDRSVRRLLRAAWERS
jgi:hypothetical protein